MANNGTFKKVDKTQNNEEHTKRREDRSPKLDSFIQDYYENKWDTNYLAFEFKSDEASADLEKLVAKNSDDNSRKVIQYAEAWAKLMQAGRNRYGFTITQMAEETSWMPQYPMEFLTGNGYAFDAAVDLLYKYWKYGDELSAWYATTKTA